MTAGHPDYTDFAGSVIPFARRSPDAAPAAGFEPVEYHEASLTSAATRHARAVALLDDGEASKAVPLLVEALDLCRSTVGPDHRHTLAVAGNLALARVAAGQRRQGIALAEENVADRERVLGPTDPMTLAALDGLAGAYRLDGQVDAAIGAAKRAVVGRADALGPKDEDTLLSYTQLVLSLAAAGDRRRAVSILRKTLDAASRELGEQHPYTQEIVAAARAHDLLDSPV